MRRVKALILATIIATVYCIAIASNAFADASRNYSTCLSQSGYSNVSSVQWACNGWANEGIQHCSLWLGNGSGATVIYTTVLSGSITAYFWGMCTKGQAGTSRIYVNNDNGSIDDAGYLYRGTWGSPNYIDTSINIGKFVQYLTPTLTSDGYNTYSRNVEIGRCHESNPSSCSEQWQEIIVKIKVPETTFSGSVKAEIYDGSWQTSTSTNPIKTDDTSSRSLRFTHTITRNNDGDSGTYRTSWSTSLGTGNKGTASSGGYTNYLSKNGSHTVRTDTSGSTGTLTRGVTNTYCQNLHYKGTNSNGSLSNDKTANGCVYIYAYRWDTWQGRVTPIASGTSGDTYNGIYYVDADTANLTFKHDLKRSDGSKQTRFYTTKGNNLGTSFPTQSEKDSNVSGTDWYTVFNSPSSPASVNVAKNNGTQYCETLHWMKDTREDRGDNYTGADKIKNWTSTDGCITLRRYKTTFTGTIAVNYKEGTSSSGSWEKVYSAGASEIVEGKTGFQAIEVKGSDLPQPVQVQFIHKVTRLGDTPQLNIQKASYFTTSTTGSKGVRNGDTVGNPVTNKSTKLLSKDGYDEYIDTFTVYVYPEQEITLCQTLNYGSELQGTEWAEGRAGTRCFKLTRKHISCMDDYFGIKNAKNYLKMDIYKNGTSATGAKTTGRLESGNTTITMWAKPQDTVRYNYTLCAAADLASQFYYNKSTSYEISTNKSGYLFGTTLSTANEYAETSKEVGKTNPKAGVGPFKSGDVYLYMTTIKSPSDDANSLYQCYNSAFIPDFYQIAGIYPAKKGDDCKSDDYGFSGDVGHIFTQTATWTDLWYEGGGYGKDDKGITHDGSSNATATGEVRVPYNYKTSVTTSAGGGNIVYGHSSKFNVRLAVNSRKNKQVNDETPYTTYTKETKAELVQIVISPDVSSAKAKEFNDLINNLEFIQGSEGNELKDLLAAKIGYGTYTTPKTVAKKVYDAGFNDTILEHELRIPDNESEMAIGTKICYIAGVWPADSHDRGNDDIDSENQSVALTPNSTLWHISAPSCYTVAKRPSMTIFNADAYAPGGIYGITNKRTNGQSKKEAMFGSWSEYGLVAGMQGSGKGEIKGVASGAALRAGAETNSIPNGTNRICYFSALTFTNTNCEDLGKLPVDTTTASYPSRIAAQIIARYTSRNDAEAVQSGNNINILGACSYDQATGTFIPTDGNYKCLNNGTKYVHIKGNAYINTGSSSICVARGTVTANRTIVIDSDNTLYVQQNLVYGNANSGVRRTGGCYENEYTTIAEIPQVILIGKKIVIDEDVTHLDAWLIADEISTCNFEGSDVNARNCNKTLTVNGPVITKKLNLLRTAGGDGIKDGYPTNGKSAEIFYLGPETYLWSYNQATRYSQATTTYQRELAPRY